jgi:GPI mannosyltransferase 3
MSSLPTPEELRFLRRWSAIGLALILVAAVQSDGYLQLDEHFQTLEFAGFKLGRTPEASLPWEYRAHLRAWLQPALYTLAVKVMEAAGIEDPFRQALWLRILSGLAFWIGLSTLLRSAWLLLPDSAPRRLAVRLSWLCFCVPFLAVRTSSESLGTACFLLGLAALVRAAWGAGGRALLPAAGAAFGLAFQFRFAVGVMIAGVLAWALLSRRLRAPDALLLALGVLPTLALGALVDRWGYGVWELPALRYVVENLGHGVAAARFGALPVYGYLTLAAHHVLAPLILFAFAGVAAAWMRRPDHLLTAATFPFVAAHVLIAHKELRFLLPVAVLAPLLLVAAAWSGDGWLPALRGRASRVALGTIFVLDLLALAALTLVPPRPEIGFQRFAYRLDPGRFEAVLLGNTPSPWRAGGLPMHFYQPRELELTQADGLGQLPRRRHLVVLGAFGRPQAEGFSCRTLYRSFPDWLAPLAPYLDPRRGWSLHHCRPT